MIKQDILENHHKPIYLGIGSNIGNRKNNINRACYFINDFCTIKYVSNFYETKSWPKEYYPKYLNIILKCYSNLRPCSLLKRLKKIEKTLGRKKTARNLPRTCDIDIIDYKGFIHDKINIEIPHPRLSDRNFVLIPLFEIEKTWKHPKSNIPIHKLLKNLDLNSLRSIKIF